MIIECNSGQLNVITKYNDFISLLILYTKIIFRGKKRVEYFFQSLQKSRREWSSIFMPALDGRCIFVSQNVKEEILKGNKKKAR